MTLHNEDRELQIELTRLQIRHEHMISRYTIFISVFLSLVITSLSVYVPIGFQTGNSIYFIFATTYSTVLLLPIVWNVKRMAETEKELEDKIKKLKSKYVW